MAIPAKRLTVNDLRDEDGFSFYVMNRSTEIFKIPTHLMVPHTSPDNGDVRIIEIPMTTNPIDLSEWAPKDELLRNSELMRMIQRGVLEIVWKVNAEKVLDTPAGRIEQDRLQSDRLSRLSGMEPPKEDENFRSVLPPEMQARGAPGDLDTETIGVNPIISDAMNAPVADEAHRTAIMRNLRPMMTTRDKQYIRSKSSDPEIRAIVGD